MSEISVIVPVYNTEKYLYQCIDSILSQTFKNFELLLINDGSTDNSGKICDEYAEKDNRVRVFHQENQGQATARNFGVSQANTEWISFVDSDDIVHPQMLELLFDAINFHRVDISLSLLTSSNNISANELNLSQTDRSSCILYANEETFLKLFADSRYHSVCSKIIKKSLLEKIPFENGRIHEDSPVICKWIYEAKHIAYSPNILYVYNENLQSTTRRSFSFKSLDMMWAWEQQESFFEEIGFYCMKKAVEIRHIYTASILYQRMRKNDRLYKKQALKFRKEILTKYKHTLRYSDFTKADKLYTLENFFPKLLKIYWILANALTPKK